MTFALVANEALVDDTSTSTLALPAINQAAGQLIIASITWESTDTTVTVADTAGNTFTPLTKRKHTTTDMWVQEFYCLNSLSNATNVTTFTWAAAAPFKHGRVGTFSFAGTAAFGTEGTIELTGGTANGPIAITPSGTSANLLHTSNKIFDGSPNSIWAGAGSGTWVEQGPNFDLIYTQYQPVVGTGAINGGANNSSAADQVLTYSTFYEVVGGGATNTSDADQFILGSLGRYAKLGRGASGSRFVKQRPNDAGPVLWSDFWFDAAVAGGHFTVNFESAAYSIAASPVTLRRHLGTSIVPTSYAIALQQVDLQVTRRVQVVPTSYSLAFSAVTLRAHRKTPVVPASYNLAFQAVSLTRSRILHVSPTSYALAFSPVTGLFSRKLVVSPTAYTLSFPAVTLTYTPVSGSYLLSVDPTSYVISAAAVDVKASRKLPVSPTSYSLAFSPVTLSVSRKVSVVPTAYSLSFPAVTLRAHRQVPVVSAAYVLNAAAVSMTAGIKLVVSPASYTLNFADVALQGPGAVFPPEAQVLLGVLYGPTGVEYTGEYADRIRYELSTGRFVKPIGGKLSLLL